MSISYDPFHRLDELRDRLLSGGRTPSSFPMDAYRRGDEFVVHMDLPGVQPETIDVAVENQVLTVGAERGSSHTRGTSSSSANGLRGASTARSGSVPRSTRRTSRRATRTAA